MSIYKFKFWILALSLVMQPMLINQAAADRIKDLTSVAGARSNQLIGYGLVVGLQGTGDEDKISFTAQSLKKVLDSLGVDVDGPISNYDLFNRGVANLAYDKTKLDNVASVLVTATLPAFAKPGPIDSAISVIVTFLLNFFFVPSGRVITGMV